MRWASCVLICLFLTGCGSAATAPEATQTFGPLVILLTEIPISTTNPTATSTLTSTLTPIATSQPSLTPLPIQKNSVKIQQLLLTNGGCRLPCFWGIKPGETSTAEFIQFVNQVSAESLPYLSEDKERYIFSYVPPIKKIDTSFSVLFFHEDQFIQAIGIKLESAYLSFPLTRLLSEYGMPDQVLIGNNELFDLSDLFVLYEEQRIVGQYRLSSNQADYLCLDPKSVVGIVTWAKGKDWLVYVSQIFGTSTTTFPKSFLKPIDQVVTYDMNDFFKHFSTKNRNTCMEMLKTKP